MIQLDRVQALREQVRQWRSDGQRIALVPTMGNLHAGHLRLVQRARELADRVLVSIFVNPLQFAEGEDLDAYPRTMAADQAHLRELAVDLLFAPPVEELYHRPREEETRVLVPGISEILCGASRPGHFTGVATVVCKLFNMAQPDVAVFGEKDYQQLQVIRRMVEDLQIPVTIEGVPTVREADGLAMSSRNGYLTADERARAPALYQALQQAAADLQRGERDYARIEAQAIAALENAGLRPDYFQIRRAADLQPPAADEPALVLLAAAYLGRARLIDNLQLTLGAGRT